MKIRNIALDEKDQRFFDDFKHRKEYIQNRKVLGKLRKIRR